MLPTYVLRRRYGMAGLDLRMPDIGARTSLLRATDLLSSSRRESCKLCERGRGRERGWEREGRGGKEGVWVVGRSVGGAGERRAGRGSS
eukprot:497328-Rhodomonas_salina.5